MSIHVSNNTMYDWQCIVDSTLCLWLLNISKEENLTMEDMIAYNLSLVVLGAPVIDDEKSTISNYVLNTPQTEEIHLCVSREKNKLWLSSDYHKSRIINTNHLQLFGAIISWNVQMNL